MNAVAPGTVLFPEHYTAAEKRRIERRIPLRSAGTPEDVANAVLYLSEAPYVTGAILPSTGVATCPGAHRAASAGRVEATGGGC